MSQELQIVPVQIEIPYGNNVKYEIDHKTGQLICDRFLHGPFAYPFNYGYIAHTLGGDSDPLDAVVICKRTLLPTCIINCKIIGALITTDENGRDEKILLVPSDKVDPYNKHIENYTDLDSHTLDEIKYFFEHYKDLEAGKFIKVESFVDRIAANKLYDLGCKLYESNSTI
jgi:inorganic pyrophosphatase